MVITHLLVDCRDAMGANAVNTMAEAVAPRLETLTGGRVYLRIISNLAVHRKVRASATWPAEFLGGAEVVDGSIAAYAFACADPFRVATHNKGIMNGIDPVVIATGNDWRAIEAGAHSYGGWKEGDGSFTRWEKAASGDLRGSIELPMAVGLGGGGQAHQLLQRQLPPLLDNVPKVSLPLGQLGQLAVHRQRPHEQPLAPALRLLANGGRQHRLHRHLGSAAVVVGDPADEPENRRRDQRLAADRLYDFAEVALRRRVEHLRHHAHHLARAERHLDPRAFVDAGLQLRRHEVIKLPADSDVQCHTGNHAMAGQLGPRHGSGARRKPLN